MIVFFVEETAAEVWGSSQERTKMEVGGGRLAIKKRLGCVRPKVVSRLKTPKMEIGSRNYIQEKEKGGRGKRN